MWLRWDRPLRFLPSFTERIYNSIVALTQEFCMMFSYALLVRENQSSRKHCAAVWISLVFCYPLETGRFMEVAMPGAQTPWPVCMGNMTLLKIIPYLKYWGSFIHLNILQVLQVFSSWCTWLHISIMMGQGQEQDAPHGILHPALGCSHLLIRMWTRCSGPRGGQVIRGWRTSPVEMGWESGACSGWRREGPGEIL